MNKIAVTLLLVCALAVGISAQKKMKPWTEWSEKEAQKILDNSPWGQTQSDVDTSEMFYTPTTQSGGGNSASRIEQGATNQATGVNFRIRFLSAKPIRQAFARLVELKQKTPNPELSEQLRSFVERDFSQWIVVAVNYDSRDGRYSGPVMQALNSANIGLLQNKTYLEIKGGKRLFLQDYKAPINDGMGAKFIFPRMVDGEPFIKPDSGEVRFYSEVGKTIKLNMRFKVSEMIYEGKLEY
jgi:hypothetical protein